MSSSNCCLLTTIQNSQEPGQVVWHSHLSQYSTACGGPHSQRFGIVNKGEMDVFLELACFFNDLAAIGNLISGSFAFSKSSLNIWKFMVQVLLKPSLENFEHYFASMWDECNCVVFGAFFGIAFLWDWNEYWLLPVLWIIAEVSKFGGLLSAALSQHYLLGFKIAQLEFHHLHELCS